jgi:transposase
MSRQELMALVGERDARIAAQDGQITAMTTQISELLEANEALAARLAKLEHLLSRDSENSSSPPSKDDDPGKIPPPAAPKRRGDGPNRGRGKQSGAPGTNLAWREVPDAQKDRFPQGRRDRGNDLAGATDLGVVDRYQQHEIPQVRVTVTQYDQHSVRCDRRRVHTAARPGGARSWRVGYGPDPQGFLVYLMVVHFVPAHRCVALVESLTGVAPSVGFAHGTLERAVGLLVEVDKACTGRTRSQVAPVSGPQGRLGRLRRQDL